MYTKQPQTKSIFHFYVSLSEYIDQLFHEVLI